MKVVLHCYNVLEPEGRQISSIIHIALLGSRHTVVCRAAQEAGAQPREYIDRKKQNAIFAPP